MLPYYYYYMTTSPIQVPLASDLGECTSSREERGERAALTTVRVALRAECQRERAR